MIQQVDHVEQLLHIEVQPTSCVSVAAFCRFVSDNRCLYRIGRTLKD